MHCTWQFYSNIGIKLTSLDIDLATDSDHVIVYDGPTSAYKPN